MAEWSAEVFQNEFLSEGSTEVQAVVSTTCTGAGQAGATGTAGEIIIVDTSGSMDGAKMIAARTAAAAAVAEILDGTWFAVIAGSHVPQMAYPAKPMLVQADTRTRAEATAAVRGLYAGGGTAIGAWLGSAGQLFDASPATQNHAILLTDGKDESETPEQLGAAINFSASRFQCDCRGVGSDWAVAELRTIATALLGTVGLIADPGQLSADFASMMRASMGRGVADARLRVWVPKGAQLVFVRQVAPTLEDLTARGVAVSELVKEFPTGSWGDETRDFHVAVEVGAKPAGTEQLAARVQLVVNEAVVAQGLVRALWSDDATLTTRIDAAVAHYTGQTELADAIQAGLAAKATGDDHTATVKLGRAVQLAAATGDDEATDRLRRVVDIDDPATGTVRIRRDASKLDEMALDTSSTKTTRVRR